MFDPISVIKIRGKYHIVEGELTACGKKANPKRVEVFETSEITKKNICEVCFKDYDIVTSAKPDKRRHPHYTW